MTIFAEIGFIAFGFVIIFELVLCWWTRLQAPLDQDLNARFDFWTVFNMASTRGALPAVKLSMSESASLAMQHPVIRLPRGIMSMRCK